MSQQASEIDVNGGAEDTATRDELIAQLKALQQDLMRQREDLLDRGTPQRLATTHISRCRIVFAVVLGVLALVSLLFFVVVLRAVEYDAAQRGGGTGAADGSPHAPLNEDNPTLQKLLEENGLDELGGMNPNNADGIDAVLYKFRREQAARKAAEQQQRQKQQQQTQETAGLVLRIVRFIYNSITGAIAGGVREDQDGQVGAGGACAGSGSAECARSRLARLSRTALSRYGADAEEEIFKLYAMMDASSDPSLLDSGDCLRSTYAIVGGKLYFRPRIEERDLYLRKGTLVPRVENVTVAEMLQIAQNGTSFIDVFSALKTYQNFTGRPCMAMHHLGGFRGPAKRLVGILINEGRDFIMAVNPVVNGRSEDRVKARYRSTLCGKVFLVDRYLAVSINYVKFDSLFYDNAAVDHHAGDGLHGQEDAERKRFFKVKQEWFKGDVAVCLQMVDDEFHGRDICEQHGGGGASKQTLSGKGEEEDGDDEEQEYAEHKSEKPKRHRRGSESAAAAEEQPEEGEEEDTE
jgi:hypothetical protein